MTEKIVTTSLGQWTLDCLETEDLGKAHPLLAPKLVAERTSPPTQEVPLRSGPAFQRLMERRGLTPEQAKKLRGEKHAGVNLGNPGIQASSHGVLSTQHHEALHNLVDAIAQDQSPEAAKAYVHHLYQALEPDTRVYFLRSLKLRGLDPENTKPERHHKLMEEALASLVSHVHDAAVRGHHEKHLGSLTPELDKSNKTSFKRIQALSQALTPEVLATQPEVDLTGQTVKK